MATKKKAKKRSMTTLREVMQVIHRFGTRLDDMAVVLDRVVARRNESSVSKDTAGENTPDNVWVNEARLGWPKDLFDARGLAALFAELKGHEEQLRLATELRRIYNAYTGSRASGFCLFRMSQWPTPFQLQDDCADLSTTFSSTDSVRMDEIFMHYFHQMSVAFDTTFACAILYSREQNHEHK